ncbi:Z1 domain-containing protein [Chloroflexota bacterium]
MSLLTSGDFYSTITSTRGDSPDLQSCMENTVSNLLDKDTDLERPAMLLGKIQSGKTRAFIGIMALAFDNGYDMAIVLQKGTKALTEQTVKRLNTDFRELQRDDRVQIHDILIFPDNLVKYVLDQKLIIVVKKEVHNLRRVIDALENTYPDLSKRKLLIIDDEADFASIGFSIKRQTSSIELTKIASQINELRNKVADSDYLQVTATPYSLYLQPDDINVSPQSEVFKPTKPAFTEVLPTYPGYVGGDFYFNESENENSLASFIYQTIPDAELLVLKHEDRRVFKIEEALSSYKINILRKAIVSFIVGSCIRRLQERKSGNKENRYKYSFVVHTETQKDAHSWQERVVRELRSKLYEAGKNNVKLIHELVKVAYEDLYRSVQLVSSIIPSLNEVTDEVLNAFQKDFIMVSVVNSEKQVAELLNDEGQLKLATPLNIFIGGQILDRGITIDNLIGFYYGRMPRKYQQDTVLQHSRMFGNRRKEDLSVTRFYTAQPIYQAMSRINEFDSALRDEFSKFGNEAGIVFIYKDPSNAIIPCSPNKIKLSATVTIKPYSRMLPIGFQIKPKNRTREILSTLDELILDLQGNVKREDAFLIDLISAKQIIDRIHRMFSYEVGFEWDCDAVKSCMEFLSNDSRDVNQKGKVWTLVRYGRDVRRILSDGSFFHAPDTSHIEGNIARQVAVHVPMLTLFRHLGKKSNGWTGLPFWWPVLYAPSNTRTTIYTREALNI